MDEIKKIMAAVGFSEYAEGIFKYADQLASKLGAQLVVATVINSRDVEAVGTIAKMGYALDSEKYIEELKAQVQKLEDEARELEAMQQRDEDELEA